ncbi:hypothetical protein [Spartinivicinus ruber]|uniref:hypothetical protein n=1 Tax=Spartinivicinus ruber TaxID=2683272 RepID=UPI0013D00E26|nr:hypothetical protein [Spartinivicinus ruber]
MLINKFSAVLNRTVLKATTCLFALFLASATTAMEEVDNELTNQYKPAIETLHGLQVTEKAVTIVVTSTGCTQKDDFIVVLDKSMPPEATFIRLMPDYCRAASRNIPIQFSLKEVGAAEFTVGNRVKPGNAF